MEILNLNQGNPDYPNGLLQFNNLDIPKSIALLGNPEILKNKMLALFCSVRCPGRLIIKAYDLIQELGQTDITIISGFHSPIERAMLNILLRGSNPVVICPARCIEKMRIRSEYKKLISDGRFLIISPFIDKPQRPTSATSLYRNQFIIALAEHILVIYAEPSGKTEKACVFALECRKSLYTLGDPANSNLVELGAKPVYSAQEMYAHRK